MTGRTALSAARRVGSFAPLLLIAAVVWLGALAGWPGWWISLMVLTVGAAVAAAVIRRRVPTVAPALTMCVMAGVVAASAGAVATAAVDLAADRSLRSDRAELRRDSGGLICRILTRGTDADRVAAQSVSTGELTQRLASVAGVLDSGRQPDSSTRCIPVTTGLGSVTAAGGDVIVAVNLTDRAGAQESSSGRVIAAHLERVGGTWKVATLDLIR